MEQNYLLKDKSLEEEVKEDNHIAAIWLLYYSELHEKYQTYLKECQRTGKGKKVFYVREITKDAKLKNAKNVYSFEEVEKWLKVIETVEENLTMKLHVFLILRRRFRDARGRRGWTAAVQLKFSEEVAKHMDVEPEEVWIESRNTFTRWWDKIVEYTARLALRQGLL